MVKVQSRTFRKSVLSVAVKSALCVGLVPGLLMAQTNDDEKKLDEVVVTGSRIPRLDPQMVTPVQMFDKDYIENSNAANLTDFLFTANFAGPGLITENTTLAQKAGSSNFDSRGFGAGYVVILLNGRRLPADPLGGDSATNLNLVPISAVERVEYLSTGASAIYGADAVQGVVNIITKQDYTGLDAGMRYDNSTGNDGGSTSFDVTGGISNDKGFVTLAFDYQNQLPVGAAGLPLIGSTISPAGDDGRSSTGFPGTWLDFGPDAVSQPAVGCPASSLRPSAYGLPGAECAYDFAALYQAIPAQNRTNFLTNAEYHLSDNITGYGEFRISRNVTKVRNGAAPAFFFLTGAPILAEVDATYGTHMADSPYVYMARRSVDAGPRATDATNTAFSTVLGARVDFGGGRELDIYGMNVESEMNQVGVGGQISSSALTLAVVGDAANGIDPILDPRLSYDPQFYADNGISISTQRQAVGTENSLNVQFTGAVGEGTSIGYAVGGMLKKDSFYDRADVASTTGDVAGGASSNGNGEREIHSLFAELSYNPIDIVELSLATRWDDYTWTGLDTDAGDNALTYTVGVSVRPVDQLLLRASYGTGFKAPSLGELFLGRSFGVDRAVDTTQCNTVTNTVGATPEEIANACRIQEIRSVSGGNPNLTTESSTNYSFGMVYQPLDNWSIALDYYNIKVDDKIGALSTQEILNNELLYPELVTRINGSVACNNGCEVRSNNQNLYQENGQGIDLSTQFNFDFSAGSIISDIRISYLLKHERQSSAVQPLCDDAGTTSEPQLRANGQFGWQARKWNTTVTLRYLGPTDDLPGGRDSANFSCDVNPLSPKVGVDSYLEVGLRGTYNVTDKAVLEAGVQNLFSEDPPFSATAAGGWPWYDQSLYNPRGAIYHVNLKYNFF